MKLEKLGPVVPERLWGFFIPKDLNNAGGIRKVDSSLVGLDFKELFLVFRRPFPLVGNDACDGRRNSRISRRAARFDGFVQHFAALFHPGPRAGFYRI